MKSSYKFYIGLVSWMIRKKPDILKNPVDNLAKENLPAVENSDIPKKGIAEGQAGEGVAYEFQEKNENKSN